MAKLRPPSKLFDTLDLGKAGMSVRTPHFHLLPCLRPEDAVRVNRGQCTQVNRVLTSRGIPLAVVSLNTMERVGRPCCEQLRRRTTRMYMPRTRNHRPLPAPLGSRNLAFISQFVEIPDDVVFRPQASQPGRSRPRSGWTSIEQEFPG